MAIRITTTATSVAPKPSPPSPDPAQQSAESVPKAQRSGSSHEPSRESAQESSRGRLPRMYESSSYTSTRTHAILTQPTNTNTHDTRTQEKEAEQALIDEERDRRKAHILKSPHHRDFV